MKSEELKELFLKHEVKQIDFVKWANDMGINIRAGDVSRQVIGAVKISRFAQLAYRCYFASIVRDSPTL